MSQDNRKKYAETPDGKAVTGGIDAPESPVASLDGSKEAPAADAGAALRCAETGEIKPAAIPAGEAGGQQDALGAQGAASGEAAQDTACPSESDEPFEGEAEDIADLAEVIARDERSATLPPKGTSSVATALGQRPSRLAKPKRGPRTNMLEQLIPEVVIPTDALKTMGFAKVRVVESSELEQIKKAAQADPVQGAQGEAAVGEGQGEAPDTEGATGDGNQAALESKEDAEGTRDGRTRDGGVVVREGKKSPSERPYAHFKDAKAKALRKGKRIFTPFRIAVCAILLVVLSVAAAGGAFAWDRWYRYDDSQDIQGEWKMTNAERTVVITENKIKIADNVSYGYTLDTHDKTITYSFGDDSMTAAYRFSPDRQCLIIDESGETDWLVAMHLKEDKVLADRDVPQGVSKLSKLSNDTEAEPKDTEEIREDEDIWSGGTWVDGYFDYKRPKIETAEEKEEAERKEAEKKKKQQSGSSEDGDSEDGGDDSTDDGASEDETDEYDDGAAYVDEETGARYYYDSSQMLYYDLAGNYYYDMYGNNPYYPPAADDGVYY